MWMEGFLDVVIGEESVEVVACKEDDQEELIGCSTQAQEPVNIADSRDISSSTSVSVNKKRDQ